MFVTGLSFAAPIIAQAPADGPAVQAAPTVEALAAKRDAKLQSLFLKKASWFTDFDAAKAESKKTGKPILAYFTRSYAACGPCDAFQSGTLCDAAFVDFAKSVVLFCHLTTRVPGDKYQDLLAESGGKAYPYAVFMDATGHVLAPQGERSVAGLETTLRSLKPPAAARRQPAHVDDAARPPRARADNAAEVAAQNARRQAALIDAEIAAIIDGDCAGTLASRSEAAAKLLNLKAQGKLPTGAALAKTYWRLLFEHGLYVRDFMLADVACAKLRVFAFADPMARKDFAPLEQRLAAAKLPA